MTVLNWINTVHPGVFFNSGLGTGSEFTYCQINFYPAYFKYLLASLRGGSQICKSLSVNNTDKVGLIRV